MMMTSHSRSRFSLLTSCVLFVYGSLGIELSNAQKKPTRDSQVKSAQIDSLIANASAAMPEVSADLLIKIAESGLLSNRQKRIELLEEAFRRSGDVQEKTRREMWTGAVDSRGGYLSAAFDQQLDALSLRCRTTINEEAEILA